MIETVIEFFRYGITGILCLVVYVVLSNALYFFEIPIWIATSIAWCFSAATSYFGHIHFSYKVTADHKRMSTKFAIMLGIHLGLTFLITYICAGALALPYMLTTVITVCLTPLVTFPIGKLWVFKERTKPIQEQA